MSDYELELFKYDKDGDMITTKYKGVWLLSDNVYLTWSTTIPPFKQTNIFSHNLFSEWVESMRKNIECDFGILKGRLLILKYGIRFQSVEKCDKLFKTLCVIHNLLLKADGLDIDWMGYEESLVEDNKQGINFHQCCYVFIIHALNKVGQTL